MKIKFLSSICMLALLTGCVTQQPAPVSNGYEATGLSPSTYFISEPVDNTAIKIQRNTANYYAKSGDTFYSISRVYDVPVEALHKRNNLSKHAVIQEGQKLIIPSTSWLKGNGFSVSAVNKDDASYRLTDKYKDVSESTKNFFERAVNVIAGGADSVSNGVTHGINGVRKLAGKPTVTTKSMAAKKVEVAEEKGVRQTIRFTKNEVKTETTPVVSTVFGQQKIHTVKSGDNIYRIGLRYGVSQSDIMAANNIDKPQSLVIGQKLIIPSAGGKAIARERTAIKKPIVATNAGNQIKQPTRNSSVSAEVQKIVENAKKGVQPITTTVNTASTKSLRKSSVSGRTDYTALMKKYSNKGANSRGMIWPARGKILKRFGDKGKGVNHTGIAIGLPKDAPIRAAESGTVIYSDSGLKSYGNLILVKHSGGYVTAYAHNSANMVKKNSRVRKGDVIAFAGNTGNVENTQLHFEVRKNNRAVNPLGVLPR